MPNNADDFARDLAKQLEAVQKAGSELHRAIGLDLLKRVIDRSPVGNRLLWKINEGRSRRNLLPKDYIGGHLRHNWQTTIDKVTDAELEGVSRSAAATYRREEAIVQRAPFGCIIYIQNPVPYAERVMDKGHSKQVPLGSFTMAVQEVRSKYNLAGGA